MQSQFTVQIDSFHKISKIPNAWSDTDFKALLTLMGLGDDVDAMDAAELHEMCMMSLNDLTPQEAAAIVLTHLFPELAPGQVEQISHDMLDERAWEEYPDCLFHEGLFNAYGLLRDAFNGTFTKPTGVELTMTVTASQAEDMAMFDTSPHSAIVRLLASGQSDDALIHRLFEDQLQGQQFPEAEGIVWQLKQTPDNDVTRQFSLVSSFFWLGGFEETDSFDTTSHGDSGE